MTTLRNEIKTALRIKINDDNINDEIDDMISACKQDMILAGVNKKLTDYSSNPLVKQAHKFYAKAYFCGDDKSERFKRAYEALRDRMALGDIEL